MRMANPSETPLGGSGPMFSTAGLYAKRVRDEPEKGSMIDPSSLAPRADEVPAGC
jgi:hypothetical protein